MPMTRLATLTILLLAATAPAQENPIEVVFHGTNDNLELTINGQPANATVMVACSIDVESDDPFVNAKLEWAYPDFIPSSLDSAQFASEIALLNPAIVTTAESGAEHTVAPQEVYLAVNDIIDHTAASGYATAASWFTQDVPSGGSGSTTFLWDTQDWPAARPSNAYIPWESLQYIPAQGSPPGTTYIDSIALATQVVTNQLSETNPLAVQQIVGLMGEDTADFSMNFAVIVVEDNSSLPKITVPRSARRGANLPVPDTNKGRSLIRKATQNGYIYPAHGNQLLSVALDFFATTAQIEVFRMEFPISGGTTMLMPISGVQDSEIVSAAVPDEAVDGPVRVINTLTSEPVLLNQPAGAIEPPIHSVQMVILPPL